MASLSESDMRSTNNLCELRAGDLPFLLRLRRGGDRDRGDDSLLSLDNVSWRLLRRRHWGDRASSATLWRLPLERV